jgi:GxxExxY protein
MNKVDLIYKEECYKIVGLCMEVHKILGFGFSEVVYKDALELELKNANVPYQREKLYDIAYKGTVLPHKYKADFVVYNKIITEIKAAKGIVEAHTKQTLNYVSAANIKLGIVINFGEESLKYKRVVLTKNKLSTN